jgi:ferredoxin
MKLTLDVSRCVRASSRFATCNECAKAAKEYVTLEEQLPSFAKGTGVEAAVCVGACPTEAFGLEGFSTTAFFFTFLEEGGTLLKKGEKELPCLGVLSVEHFIALALASDRPLQADLSDYVEDKRLFAIIGDRIEEANFVLESVGGETIAILSEKDENARQEDKPHTEEKSPDRRAFLRESASLKGVLKYKAAFDEALEADEEHRFVVDAELAEKIRDKVLPDKRKILYTVLKKTPRPQRFEVLAEEDISFVSQKLIENGCDNCQICYRICPTGALHTDKKFSRIDFDAMLCVKCRLCHDVCEPEAIKLQPGLHTKIFFKPESETLATFDVRRCFECGSPFTYFGGEQICPRCRIEEEEAVELIMNAKRMEKKA